MTGNATYALRRTAMQHGASAVLAKPFDTDELEAALGNTPQDSAAGTPYDVIRIPSMEEILRGNELSIAFQPIVRLSPTGTTTFAFEALTRIRGNWLAGGPTTLFQYAERRGRLAELNIVMMERAIEQAAFLPLDTSVFINVDPLAFSHPRLVPALYRATSRAGIALDRIVLEVTERSGFERAGGELFAELRAAGIRFALDDHGSAYSHLSQIKSIRP